MPNDMSLDRVKILVEIPKGSRNKYERNPETGELELDRRLFASVTYPTDYGAVEGTKVGDGDELDALVAVSEPTFPGCIIWGRPVAILNMHDEDGSDDHKVLFVPLGDPTWDSLQDLDDVPDDLCKEIEHFFRVYGQLRGRDPDVSGWGTREQACEVLTAAYEAA